MLSSGPGATRGTEGQGGNILVVVGNDGIIIVDAELAALHDKIKAAITPAQGDSFPFRRTATAFCSVLCETCLDSLSLTLLVNCFCVRPANPVGICFSMSLSVSTTAHTSLETSPGLPTAVSGISALAVISTGGQSLRTSSRLPTMFAYSKSDLVVSSLRVA
jgi:hypothetical protein